MKEYFKNVLKEVSVDCVIFGFQAEKLKVLLLRWKGTDKWSLPGGRILKDEALNDAVIRILKERTGLKDVFLQQFNTFGDTNRSRYYSPEETARYIETALGEDPANFDLSPRTISVGYYALVDINEVKARPDLYTEECQWFEIDDIPRLLFDHNEMIETAHVTLRKEMRFQPIGDMLPEKFTLNELHKLFQSILNTNVDRRNFHKLVTRYDFLIKLPERRTGVANTSPHFYRIDYKKYRAALKKGI